MSNISIYINIDINRNKWSHRATSHPIQLNYFTFHEIALDPIQHPDSSISH